MSSTNWNPCCFDCNAVHARCVFGKLGAHIILPIQVIEGFRADLDRRARGGPWACAGLDLVDHVLRPGDKAETRACQPEELAERPQDHDVFRHGAGKEREVGGGVAETFIDDEDADLLGQFMQGFGMDVVAGGIVGVDHDGQLASFRAAWNSLYVGDRMRASPGVARRGRSWIAACAPAIWVMGQVVRYAVRAACSRFAVASLSGRLRQAASLSMGTG